MNLNSSTQGHEGTQKAVKTMSYRFFWGHSLGRVVNQTNRLSWFCVFVPLWFRLRFFSVKLGLGLLAALLLGQALPAVAQPVKFGDRLFAKFQHERCLSCHQFGSREHNGRSFTSHRGRYLCAQCHQPKLIGMPADSTWVAPQDMDYTGFGATKTCKLIKQRIGYDPDGRRLAGHMLNDARVRWALESGITPGGPQPTVPGGYAEWRVAVEAWIKDGMRCE